ncbi:accessory gene regulator ArgB-like protein [Paenibacillus farraposensis]|uniref:Accessory gene regulator ArgB-like protein n=1 Tax=Paenibacillus farraposensis TaxID=2807095 RepID=A0ABW4DHI1_9BACL|nr:accessory gene regulator B family protein [Paenibacillus farraposensis]MCC3381057.1 accessory gene regulator B family protein [Paenibacillus farraposensis]
MLERLSRRIANELKRVDPDGPGSVEVLAYAIGIKLNWYSGLILTILFGWLLGDVINALLAFFSFVVLRKFSGGLHFRSLTVCAIFSAALFAAIPLIHLGHDGMLLLTAISTAIVLCMAPRKSKDLNPSGLDPYLKWISIAIVLTNFIIQSPIIALSFTAQAVLLLPWKGGEQQ